MRGWEDLASLHVYYRYYFCSCSSELVQLVPPLILEGGLIIILIDCMIFLSPFQDLCQQFLPMHSWTLELSAYRMLSSDLLFKSLELTLFNCRFFLNRFLVCFNLFVLLFLVNSMHHSVFSALHGLYPNFKKIKICDVTI